MSEPTITALVSSTKAAKKKKIGFRPVGKQKPKAFRGKPVKAMKSALKKPPTPSPQPEEDQVAERNETVESVETNEAKKAASKKLASAKKATAARKRKHSGITVGSSRTETIEATSKTSSTIDPTEAATPLSPSTEEVESPAAPSAKQSAVLVVSNSKTEEQDNNILQKLKAENPGAVRLSSFCSAFKVKKEKKDQEEKAAVAAAKQKEKQKNSAPPKKKASENESGAPVVQIVDGEIVLQESSLMFPGQRRSVKEVEAEFDVVEEDAQLAIVGASYNSFVNRKGPRHWNLAETERFFEALRQLGTDFCSMEAFFENRTRKQLKRKYTAELTKNPKLVEMALNPKYQKNVDLSVFDVEVDAKAIEAAANEEPIPYEPTNLEPTPTEEPEDKGEPNDANGEGDMEVVEEDAEAELPQVTMPTAASARFSAEQQTLWPEEDQNTAAGEFPEPSMEDFFLEHEDPEHTDQDHHGMASKPKESSAPSPTKVAAAEPASLSLVPNKKTKSKKRPKFRSAPRKKK